MAAKKGSSMPLILGLATAVGGGYYYYTYGTDTNAAQVKFDHETAKAKENAQATYESIKSSANSAADLGKHKLEEAQAKLEAERKKAATEIQNSIDQADKKIQDGATKAKGWFR